MRKLTLITALLALVVLPLASFASEEAPAADAPEITLEALFQGEAVASTPWTPEVENAVGEQTLERLLGQSGFCCTWFQFCTNHSQCGCGVCAARRCICD